MTTWTHEQGDSYLVTGVDRRGRRFAIRCATWLHASGINVWRGSKWLLRDGKRKLLQRVSNFGTTRYLWWGGDGAARGDTR